MTFGAPWGLLALLALPVLVAAYFLRRKQPPRVVSALFLWRTRDLQAEAGPRFERFTRELSLTFETLAVVCAALFLADARCGTAASSKHLVVIVDGGLSMLARQAGHSVADRVKTEVASLVQREGAGTLTLIESGPRPTVLAGPQQPVDRALSVLEGWTPSQPAHDLAPAFALARSLGAVGQRLWFFTDGPLEGTGVLPEHVEALSLGSPAANLALVSAQRHDEGGVAQVTVRVGNCTEEARTVNVRFDVVGDAPQTHAVSLEPLGTAVLRAGFKATGPIEVALPDDALSEDGRVTLLPAPLAEVKVGFVEGLDEGARAALGRFLAIAPAVTVSEPSTLRFGPPGSRAQVTLGVQGATRSFVGPFFTQKGQPLFDDVQLGGVVWAAGANPPGRVLMSMGDAILVSEEEDGTVHLNLDVAHSNVQRTVAWPVLLGNVVRAARLKTPGLPRRHLMLGEEVLVVTAPEGVWRFVGPAKQVRPILGVGVLTSPPLPAPGRWELQRDGALVDALVVLPLDPRESDLRSRGPWSSPGAETASLGGFATSRPRPLWPLVVLLLLMMADYWLTARPRRSR